MACQGQIKSSIVTAFSLNVLLLSSVCVLLLTIYLAASSSVTSTLLPSVVLGFVSVRFLVKLVSPVVNLELVQALASITYIILHGLLAFKQKLLAPPATTTLTLHRPMSLSHVTTHLSVSLCALWILTVGWNSIVFARQPICLPTGTSGEPWQVGRICLATRIDIAISFLALFFSAILFIVVSVGRQPFQVFLFGHRVNHDTLQFVTRFPCCTLDYSPHRRSLRHHSPCPSNASFSTILSRSTQDIVLVGTNANGSIVTLPSSAREFVFPSTSSAQRTSLSHESLDTVTISTRPHYRFSNHQRPNNQSFPLTSQSCSNLRSYSLHPSGAQSLSSLQVLYSGKSSASFSPYTPSTSLTSPNLVIGRSSVDSHITLRSSSSGNLSTNQVSAIKDENFFALEPTNNLCAALPNGLLSLNSRRVTKGLSPLRRVSSIGDVSANSPNLRVFLHNKQLSLLKVRLHDQCQEHETLHEECYKHKPDQIQLPRLCTCDTPLPSPLSHHVFTPRPFTHSTKKSIDSLPI